MKVQSIQSLDHRQFNAALERQREQAIAAARLSQTPLRSPVASLEAGGLHPFELSLATSFPSSGRFSLAVSGSRLIYLKQGSAPGGRINVFPGNLPMAPGSALNIGFKGLELSRAAQSAYHGRARFLVCTTPDANFTEDLTAPAVFDPPLISKSGTDVTESIFDWSASPDGGSNGWNVVTKDTVPESDVHSLFNINGWRRIRIYIDGGAANALESLTIVPWFFSNNDASLVVAAASLEQGTEAIDLPIPLGGAYRYRILTFAVNGLGDAALMGLEFRNVLPVAIATINYAVFGLE